jgi:Tfp pilus assembly protein PilX
MELQRKIRSRRARRRGAAMITTMMMITVLAVMGVSYMSMSATSNRIAYRAYQKSQATALAEAGVHAMFSQVTQTLRSGSSTMPTIATTSLITTAGGNPTNDGTYSATVLSDPYVRTAVVDGNGNTTGYIDTYTITAQGVGTSPDGLATSKVHATFTVSQRETEAVGSGAAFTFPNAAVVSNGNVLLQGSSMTKALVTLHGAGVEANGVISNNGNAYSIDGPIAAAPASYSATTAALGATPNCYQNSVSQLASPISFPDAATIATWKATWATEAAETTGNYPSGHTINGSYTTPSGNMTLTSPCVINGDLNISHNCTLTLNQDASGASPYIMYVHGNINFATGGCNVTNNGVLIVCDGVVTIGKNSTYTCNNLTSGGLISLNTSSNAISLTAGSNEQIGLCYAVNGGVLVSGTATVTGAVISGQTGATGGISLQGNPTIAYPGSLNSNFTGLPPSDNLQVTQQYTPTSPMNWVQTL